MYRTLKQKRKHKDKGDLPRSRKIKRGVTQGSRQIPAAQKPKQQRNRWGYDD